MTSLQHALERADSVYAGVRELIADGYRDTDIKLRLAAACTNLVMEHHEAVESLIRSGLKR